MNLTNLPPPLIISKMTYLSYKDVESLCNTNRRLNEICTSPKYTNDWRMLIDNTYQDSEYYQELRRDKLNYNYKLYIDLINVLELPVQLEIYKKQGDEESVRLIERKINQRNKLLTKIQIVKGGTRVLDVSRMRDDYTGILLMVTSGLDSRKIGVPGLPIVSNNLKTYQQVIELLGPEYYRYLYLYKNN